MPAVAETSPGELKPTMAARVADTVRRVAHASHEARLLTSVAEDAIEDGVYAAKRAVKSAQKRFDAVEDLKDETVRRVKRQPFKAVGVAFGAGLALGVIAGWIARPRTR
jgi:ElaB/YqjD/DUF883 family membrane-anchored ribosome-binding protein